MVFGIGEEVANELQDRSVNHFGDGVTELLLRQKEKNPALIADRAWSAMGVKPFEDAEFDAAVSVRDKEKYSELAELNV